MSEKFKAVCNICGEELIIKNRKQWSRGAYCDEEWEYVQIKCPNGHGGVNVYK